MIKKEKDLLGEAVSNQNIDSRFKRNTSERGKSFEEQGDSKRGT